MREYGFEAHPVRKGGQGRDPEYALTRYEAVKRVLLLNPACKVVCSSVAFRDNGGDWSGAGIGIEWHRRSDFDVPPAVTYATVRS